MATQENINRSNALLGLLDDTLRDFLARHPGMAVSAEIVTYQRGSGDTSDVSVGYGEWTEDRPMRPGEAWAVGLARQGLQIGDYACGCPPPSVGNRAARRRAARGR